LADSDLDLPSQVCSPHFTHHALQANAVASKRRHSKKSYRIDYRYELVIEKRLLR